MLTWAERKEKGEGAVRGKEEEKERRDTQMEGYTVVTARHRLPGRWLVTGMVSNRKKSKGINATVTYTLAKDALAHSLTEARVKGGNTSVHIACDKKKHMQEEKKKKRRRKIFVLSRGIECSSQKKMGAYRPQRQMIRRDWMDGTSIEGKNRTRGQVHLVSHWIACDGIAWHLTLTFTWGSTEGSRSLDTWLLQWCQVSKSLFEEESTFKVSRCNKKVNQEANGIKKKSAHAAEKNTDTRKVFRTVTRWAEAIATCLIIELILSQVVLSHTHSLSQARSDVSR